MVLYSYSNTVSECFNIQPKGQPMNRQYLKLSISFLVFILAATFSFAQSFAFAQYEQYDYEYVPKGTVVEATSGLLGKPQLTIARYFPNKETIGVLRVHGESLLALLLNMECKIVHDTAHKDEDFLVVIRKYIETFKEQSLEDCYLFMDFDGKTAPRFTVAFCFQKAVSLDMVKTVFTVNGQKHLRSVNDRVFAVGTDFEMLLSKDGKTLWLGNMLSKSRSSEGLGETIPEDSIKWLEGKEDFLLTWWSSGLLNVLMQSPRSGTRNDTPIPTSINAKMDFADGLMFNINYKNEQEVNQVSEFWTNLVKNLSRQIALDYPNATLKFINEMSQTDVNTKGATVEIHCKTDLEGEAQLIGAPLYFAQKKARAISCISNLKQLALAVLIFASDHSDTLPSPKELEKCLAESKLEKATFCPENREQYVYYGKAVKTSAYRQPSKVILFVCKTEHKKGYLNVCFLDGHVASVLKKSVDEAIQNCKPNELPVME